MTARIIAVILLGLSGIAASAAIPPERHVAIKATRYFYSPPEIRLKTGEPVVLDLTALDRLHGFDIPEMHIRVDVLPGQVTSVRIMPTKAGVYEFHCDNFCGSGHETMAAKIVVED